MRPIRDQAVTVTPFPHRPYLRDRPHIRVFGEGVGAVAVVLGYSGLGPSVLTFARDDRGEPYERRREYPAEDWTEVLAMFDALDEAHARALAAPAGTGEFVLEPTDP